MEFILASSNQHKAIELDQLLTPAGLNIIAAPQSLEVDETGTTFLENSLLKAQSYYQQFKRPTLADDSGLVLEGMPEMLGVYSARFAPEFKDYRDKCDKLLQIYTEKKIKDRRAYFVCYLTFYISPSQIFHFEGRVHGEIGTEYCGDHGFGYDPIFIPDKLKDQNLTLAQSPEWKDLHSHRARACLQAIDFFKQKQLPSLLK